MIELVFSGGVFASAFVTMFLVIDPIGNAAYYAVITRNHSPKIRASMALRACFVSLIIVPVFIWYGSDLLRVIHVHLPSFQMAGGLFLLLIAVHMVLHDEEEPSAGDEVKKDFAVFPMAVPLIAGPDTLSASLLLVSRGDEPGRVFNILLGFGAVLLISLILLIVAGHVARLLGPQILSAINKIIGMLLGAYAIEFIVEGATAAIEIHGL